MPPRRSRFLAAGALALAACTPTADAPSGPQLPNAPRRALNVGGVVEVTTAAVAGEGSLRGALELASTDSTVHTIRVRPGLGTITVAEPLVYTGRQALVLDGGDAVLDAAALAESAPARDAALVANGGGDLTVRRLAVRNSTGNGILVDVPTSRTGVVDVRFEGVTVTGSAEHGIIVNEQADFFTRDLESREQGGAPADLRVTASTVRAIGNGGTALDRDGLRINEGGDGSLHVNIGDSAFEENGADGVELDERGAGDAIFTVAYTRIDRNGFFSADDYDDGIDVDEIGPGLLYGTFVRVTANGNAEQGIDLNENNLGNLLVGMDQVTASGNGEEGVEFEEDDDFEDFPSEPWGGDLTATLIAVTADGNGASDGDAGIKVREKHAGGVAARLLQATARDNRIGGIQVREGEAGSAEVQLADLTALRNGADGIEVRQAGAGAITTTLYRATSRDNTGAGLRLRSAGTARVEGLVATGNASAVRAEGVTVTTVP